MTDERKQAEEYPETIFATEKIGSNGIDCLDYRNYDEDVEYIRADIMSLKVAEATKEIKFPTHDEINKASMIFDKQKRPLWKEAIYRAGANWAIDWIKQNINK